MDESRYRQALFADLVYSEDGEQVKTTFVGSEPHYVIMDGDFKRHVPAEEIDRRVVEWLQGQVLANKELVSQGIMQLIGQDDLFTKAMIDASIQNMDQVMEQGLPSDARMMLGMMGFRIIVNVHGEVVELKMPAQEFPGQAEE
jgi:hypothetical protein